MLYALLLLSSIVTGTAAMVPIFLLMFQLGLIDDRIGVALVLTGGLLPAAIFILKDFMDATPSSYEERARVFGASPLQVLRHVVLPIARPGLATIAVWAMVNAWGDFLTAVHPAARPGEDARRRADVHLLHRGRTGEPRL